MTTPEDALEELILGAPRRYTRRQLSRNDIRHSFSGVRPLYDDRAANPSAVTRDYVFDIDAGSGMAPLLSVFGGKITTYRKLAEHSLEKLAPYLRTTAPPWTAKATLPGGDLPLRDLDKFLNELSRGHSWLPARLARHFARLYGTRTERLIAGARSIDGLGERLGGLLYEREIEYLTRHEWASTAEDVLERRTKHGLHLNEAEKARVAERMRGSK